MFQNYFNFKRFYNAFKCDLMLNHKTYLSFGIGLVLGLIIIDFLFIVNNGRRFDENNYLILFYFTFLVTGILVIGTSFPLLRNKKSIVHYLMLPASSFEKVLVQLIIRVGLFIPFYVVFFWLDFKLASGIYNLFDWDYPIQIDSFSILTPYEGIPMHYTFLDKLAFAGIIFSIAAFLFAGATYYKKYVIFKTVLSFSILIGSVVFLFWCFTMIFYPGESSAGNFIYLEDYRISEHLVNFQLFFYVIVIASSLFLLPLAYFKLKEKQL